MEKEKLLAEEEYWKKKCKKDIFKLIDKKVLRRVLKPSQDSQIKLFN